MKIVDKAWAEAQLEANNDRIVIPYGVEEIAREAFSYLPVREVVIPETVIKIGAQAFYHCDQLRELNIPNSVQYIEIFAFMSSGLRSIELPDSIVSIEAGLFIGCEHLERAKLPSKLTIIPNETFYRCVSLREIEIPDHVVEIQFSAFWGCGVLENAVLPKGLQKVGVRGFADCHQLDELIVPYAVTIEPVGAPRNALIRRKGLFQSPLLPGYELGVLKQLYRGCCFEMDRQFTEILLLCFNRWKQNGMGVSKDNPVSPVLSSEMIFSILSFCGTLKARPKEANPIDDLSILKATVIN